jgi:hypothetical protein
MVEEMVKHLPLDLPWNKRSFSASLGTRVYPLRVRVRSSISLARF